MSFSKEIFSIYFDHNRNSIESEFHELKNIKTFSSLEHGPFSVVKIFSKTAESDFNIFRASRNRSSCPEVFCKNGVLENFAKFTRKQLFQSLILIKLQA